MLKRDITTYNYLIEDSHKAFPSNFDIDTRTDPDRTSKALYDDLLNLFFAKSQIKARNIEQEDFYNKNSVFYTIFVNEDEFRLSSDYIGPSIYWARECGIKDDKIINFLKISRTIGGHILWPRGKQPTLNQVKAGNNGFYDRIDWTLLAIASFYEITSEKKNNQINFLEACSNLLPSEVRHYKQLESKFKRVYKALQNHKSWFDSFGDFNNFCTFFNLKESFVDNECNIIPLTSLFPILPLDYEEYIDNSIKAISQRNNNFNI